MSPRDVGKGWHWAHCHAPRSTEAEGIFLRSKATGAPLGGLIQVRGHSHFTPGTPPQNLAKKKKRVVREKNTNPKLSVGFSATNRFCVPCCGAMHGFPSLRTSHPVSFRPVCHTSRLLTHFDVAKVHLTRSLKRNSSADPCCHRPQGSSYS